ncbi:hypothetical protein EC957_003712 [Mortierella hygrophila]|uniref:Uncharacterized protein n=1 Tax=Mortierella hygrophila TaxID=979708 RepID=A0A9P6K0M8_9FUNG|nr:hypothetical protein EC957_003712 [Mortierella hygrophila]
MNFDKLLSNIFTQVAGSSVVASQKSTPASNPIANVITRDSDALVYSNINTIWRPFGRDRYLVYHVPDLDYGKGVRKMGIKQNFKVIRALETEDTLKNASVQELVDAYMENTTVSSKYPTERIFDLTLQIFTPTANVSVPTPHLGFH